VASTKAFTAPLVDQYMLAILLGELRGTLDEAARRALVNDLRLIPDLVGRTLKREDEIKKVALALKDTLRRYRLPPEPLLALVEARSFDLYDDPMPTWLDLEGYCGETSSALIRLATIILAEGEDAGSADLCGHAGVAYAITGLLRAFPIHARRQQCYIPHEALIACGLDVDDIHEGKDSDNLRAVLAGMRERARAHFDRVRGRIGELDPRLRAAFLPVCLCPTYLEAMERPDYQPFHSRIDISPLRRLFILGRSAWRARR
jgi:phytoene synthase